MDLYLHLGPHLTGVSALHRWLEAGRTRLADRGVALWLKGETRDGRFSGLFAAPQAVDLACERRGQRSCGVIRLRLADLVRAGMDRLVVSDPDLLGPPQAARPSAGRYPHVDERLLRLAPAIGPLCRRVGLALRSYADLAEDMAALQLWLTGRWPASVDLSAEGILRRRWPGIVAEIRRALPGAEVALWSYERLADRPEAQLARLTGDPAIADGLPQPAAPGPGAVPDLPALRKRLRFLGRPGLAEALGPGDGRWQPLDPHTRLRVEAAYARDLDRLGPMLTGASRAPQPTPDPPPDERTAAHDRQETRSF